MLINAVSKIFHVSCTEKHIFSVIVKSFSKQDRLFKNSRSMALNANDLKVEYKPLYKPPLQELADVLNQNLTYNFAEVHAEVVDCPDLRKEPFTLASEGLGGNPRVVEIGGVPYLAPIAQLNKVYDLKDIERFSGLKSAFIVGAGAGPHPYAGVNCEGIINMNVKDGKVEQQTRISKVVPSDGSQVQEILPNSETRIALLANLFYSEGKPGKVLKVHVKKRIGSDDFVTSIRETLAKRYFDDKIIGLGGTFLLKEGKAKQHVMPAFSKTPLNSGKDIDNWLKFYNMSAPLIAVGTLETGDPGLDLRVQHFHSFSHHGEAGHYHIDTTPETVEYLGFFNIGEYVYRVDAPAVSHSFGRD
ncbi:ester hydrolase C11orf54 homolog isoform X2 [Agrilus planipennis]|uniref:Ester hydrolase C11orf54 homolog isoform X2 n=1 Tax=Agrilus planipennis TaxID=224129 RepID=A0A1W4XLR3_AGRPL|nr:ester hydrolase C11orf54 homolog isoform X2 [Agrilus planipennis]